MDISFAAYIGGICVLIIVGGVLGSIVVLSLTSWWSSSKQLPDTGTDTGTSTHNCDGDYPSCAGACGARLPQVFTFANLTPTNSSFASYDPNGGVLYVTDGVSLFNYGVAVDSKTGVFDSTGAIGANVRGSLSIESYPPSISFAEPSGLAMAFIDPTDPNGPLWSLPLPFIKHEGCITNDPADVYADVLPGQASVMLRCLGDFGAYGVIAANNNNHGADASICTFVANMNTMRGILMLRLGQGVGPGARGPRSPIDVTFGPIEPELTFRWTGCSGAITSPIEGFIDLVMGAVHIQYDGRRIALDMLDPEQLNIQNLLVV